MFYLLHHDTYQCVNFQAIIGITENKNGIYELLFNYYKQNLKLNPNMTFENSHDNIKIYSISEENYDYLLDNINNKRDKIDKNLKQLNFTHESQQSYFIYVILNNDGNKYDIFNKKFHTKYDEIIENSQLII